MHKKAVIVICSVFAIALLSVSMLSYVHVGTIRDEARTLADTVEALENNNAMLQTENEGLRETLASIRQGKETPEQTDDTWVDTMFEKNPIDSYFLEMDNKLEPTTTVEMAELGHIESSAWEAEMINCYEILASKTNVEYVRDCLEKERTSYVDYIKNNTETDIFITLSGAFFGEDDPGVGTLSHVVRPSAWAEGYSKKTLELFKRLNEIGAIPQFIFSAEKYDEQLKQAFPDLWEKSFE